MNRLLHVLFTAWLLLALPLGQHEALLHALAHAGSAQGSDDGAPSPEKCPDHSLYTSFAGAVGTGSISVPAIVAQVTGIDSASAACVALAPRYQYLSRAPPADSANG